MRVCDITKLDEVKTRYVIIEVPLDFKEELILPADGEDAVRVAHDLEVGSRAAEAIEKKDWRELTQLTPWQERSKDERRQQAAKKAGQTRKRNKAGRQEQTTAAEAQQGGEGE
jgi:hypothetical protein